MLSATKIYKDLKDQLHHLDQEREWYFKKVEPFKYVFWTILVLGAAYLMYRLNYSSQDDLNWLILIYGGLIFVSFIAYSAVKAHYNKKFKELFTGKIAPYIIRGLDPSFKYDYEGKIPDQEIKSSLLFSPYNVYQCQDLVMGVINDIPIKFAEIQLQDVVVKKNSKKYQNIFSGIFYRADLQSQFPTDIWLVGNRQTKSLKNENKDPIKLEGKALKNYRVYAKDEALARQVLQPFILEKIDELNLILKRNKVIRKPISYHFGQHWVQASIHTRNKFMEPRLGRTIDHVTFIEEQTRLLNALSTLMTQLTLK